MYKRQVLTLRRTAGTQPQAPDSVFGSISFAGARIEQGGVVRAPLGRIVFDNDLGPAGVVRFLPGSLTSVSYTHLRARRRRPRRI